MNARRHTRTLGAAALLALAGIVILMAVGCFGGGDGDEIDTGSTVASGGTNGDTAADESTTTVVALIDPLSSFISKDPFIPQAQATTTTAPPSTTAYVTTTSPPTTAPPATVAPTTTVAPGLKVLAFDLATTSVTFSVNGYQIVHRGGTDDANVYVGTWGKLKVLEVNFADTSAPWATFLRDDKYKYERLGLGETRTW